MGWQKSERVGWLIQHETASRGIRSLLSHSVNMINSVWSTKSLFSRKNHFFLTPIILDNFNKEYSFKVSIFLVVHKILLVRGTLSANFARLFKSFELGNILQVVLPDV